MWRVEICIRLDFIYSQLAKTVRYFQRKRPRDSTVFADCCTKAAVAPASVAGGFQIIVEDRGGTGPEILQEQTDRLIDRLRPPRQPDPRQIQQWIDQLGDGSEEVRQKAEKALLDQGEAAVEPLNEAARDHPDADVRGAPSPWPGPIASPARSGAFREWSASPPSSAPASRSST